MECLHIFPRLPSFQLSKFTITPRYYTRLLLVRFSFHEYCAENAKLLHIISNNGLVRCDNLRAADHITEEAAESGGDVGISYVILMLMSISSEMF